MTVIVLMVLQICCKYISTSTFDRHHEGVHFCPSSCCFFPFFSTESQMSLSFYPCDTVGTLDLRIFLIFLLV